MATSEANVIELHLVDLGNTEVRMEMDFRNTAGNRTKVGYEGKLTAARTFRDAILADLTSQEQTPAAATR